MSTCKLQTGSYLTRVKGHGFGFSCLGATRKQSRLRAARMLAEVKRAKRDGRVSV